jgi:alpha-beta hydrolase superfamily lysophospholipase
VIHREGQFAGQGALRLFWQGWLPDGDARAAVIVAHGYGEHGGRYHHLAERFAPLGFAVYMLDHRGHGRSEGPRGHVDRFVDYVADLHALRVRVDGEHRGKPLFLLGHSMGGLIAAHYLLAHSSGLAGAVLSSPALGLAKEPPRFLRWLGRLLSWIAPRTSFQSDVDPMVLSHDPSVGLAYAGDPLVHRRVTARLFTELKAAMRDALERAGEVRGPILVLQAGDDRLVDGAATERFVAGVGSEQKSFRLYPGLFHELFNEVEKERVFAELEGWLDDRAGGRGDETGELRRPWPGGIAGDSRATRS